MISKLIFVIMLSIISYCDMARRKIPNIYCFVIFLNALFYNCQNTLLDRIIGAIIITIMLIGIRVCSRRTLGWGDIKLLSCITLMLGIEKTMVGLLLGMIVALIWIVINKIKDNPIPLAPFISIGMIIVI